MSDTMNASEKALTELANQEGQSAGSFTSGMHHIPTEAMDLDMFEMGDRVGRGKFARVFLAEVRGRGFECALKVIEKADVRYGKMEAQVRDSVKIQSEMDHPNILKSYGSVEDEKKIYWVMDLSKDGCLYELLQKQTTFPEPQAARFISQIAEGIQYLHRKNVLHRNINPENILVGSDGKIKVSGFIWSKHAPDGRSFEMCGLLDYLAPEQLNRAESYDSKVDVWCLGVMIFEFLVGRAPFEDTLIMTQRRIQNVDMEVPSSISSEARDLIHKILVADPSERLSLNEFQQHPWILMHN